MRTSFKLFGLTSLALIVGCGSGNGTTSGTQRAPGQTDYSSAPPAGMSQGGGNFGASDGAGGGAQNAGAASPSTEQPITTRQVAETDIYRVDGNRLYYLNTYRGLMVFDITNVDAPKLLGRSPISGTPSQMYVANGIATVIVGDWYGTNFDGSPFHGSVVRSIDATDPTNMKQTGEAHIVGDILDARVVGDVVYTVSEDYGWEYGWGYYGYGGGGVSNGVATPAGGDAIGGGYYGGGTAIVVTSVAFGLASTANSGQSVSTVATKTYAGYSGAFYVTPGAIMLAHDIPSDPTQNYSPPSGKSRLEYLDITDPNGAINVRATMDVDGTFSGWGTDNGRWNVDFADGQHAHVLTCGAGASGYCGDGTSPYILSTVDFTVPAQPVLSSALNIANAGWSPAARFDTNRLYLSPDQGYWGDSSNPSAPVQIFDLTDPKNPTLAGSTSIPGVVWNFTPSAGKVFTLGSSEVYSDNGSQVSVNYIDATNAAAPTVLGNSTFGQGWAWTPAADTFKAFTLDATDGLVVLPFSGWDNNAYQYTNGLQVISFTPTSIKTRGAANTAGWVERGVLANNRMFSLSDMALSVVDYTNVDAPKVTAQLTLARNIVSAQPQGTTVAALDTDWWGNDNRATNLRVLPIADAQEMSDESNAPTVSIDGTNAQIYRNGDMAYVVTQLYDETSDYSATQTMQVQVVDLSNGQAKLRGKTTLPILVNNWGWGWDGYYWYDWYDGDDVVQVGGDALAFRRFDYTYQNGQYNGQQQLYVMDLSNPDAPSLASAQVTDHSDWWWGNVRAVGNTLYTTHYEWIQYPQWGQDGTLTTQGFVKYYLDQVDLSDRSHPVVGSRINVPGFLVGASQTDNSLLYFVDYRWDADPNNPYNEFSVAQIQDGKAVLQSNIPISGWMGNVFVEGNTAYTTGQDYSSTPWGGTETLRLHQIDITDPKHPVDSATQAFNGWGWLMGVAGDRAVLSSGWGPNGVDIYQLTPGQAPTFSQFARTRGWWTNTLARQDNTLFLTSGYWGVQTIQLK